MTNWEMGVITAFALPAALFIVVGVGMLIEFFTGN